jgi:hypothetical protein
MAVDLGERVQVGNRQDAQVTAEHVERARAARDVVAARAPGVDQHGLLAPIPPVLDEYLAAFRAAPGFAPYAAEAWDIALVDLRRVCAFQPNVFTDHAGERVQQVDPDDLRSIAAVSLPIPAPTTLPIEFDATKNAWLISAPNPNLRIVGNFHAQVPPGIPGFGFAVGVSPSFLQVANFQGRHFLRDGYHRAFGFVSRQIFVVPVLVKTFGPFEDRGIPAGMLPQGAYLGDQPPCIPDYADDLVSAAVELAAFQRLIVIQGLELTPHG